MKARYSKEFLSNATTDQLSEIGWDDISRYGELTLDFVDDIVLRGKKITGHKIDWYPISSNPNVSVEVLVKYFHNINIYILLATRGLTEDELIYLLEDTRTNICSYQYDLSKYVKYSDDMAIKYHIPKSLVLANVPMCGPSKRNITIKKECHRRIHIGCFYGTQEEAIKAITCRYQDSKDEEYMQGYIDAVNECFKQARIEHGTTWYRFIKFLKGK